MRLRTIAAILVCLLVALFVAINWSAFITPTTLSVVFASVEAPLGIVMLGVLVLFALAVAVYMAVWQSRTLLDLRRHTKALHEQGALADQAEASRFTELRDMIHAESERLLAQMATNQSALERKCASSRTRSRLRWARSTIACGAPARRADVLRGARRDSPIAAAGRAGG